MVVILGCCCHAGGNVHACGGPASRPMGAWQAKAPARAQQQTQGSRVRAAVGVGPATFSWMAMISRGAAVIRMATIRSAGRGGGAEVRVGARSGCGRVSDQPAPPPPPPWQGAQAPCDP